MREIVTTITVNAPLAEVWATLMDHDRYPEWNPFIPSLRGTARSGEQLEVFIQPPGQKGMRFQPKVLVVDREKEFRWRGKLLVPGLFDGEHYFRLESKGPRTTQFVHGERFSGLLAGWLFRMIEKNTKAGFQLMNEALKKRLEK